jgi:hypothetical protein
MQVDGIHGRSLVLEGDKVALVVRHNTYLFRKQEPYTEVEKVCSLTEFSTLKLSAWQMFGRYDLDLVNARGEHLRITLEDKAAAQFAYRRIQNYIHQSLPSAKERLALTA